MFQREFDSTGNITEFAFWAADFMDNLPVGMYRVTLEGELVFCNWSFAKLLGYNAPAKLQDFEVVELFPHKWERGVFVRQVLDQGSVYRYPMQLVKKDGELFACSTTARAVVNDDGQVTYIDGVMSETSTSDRNGAEAGCSQSLDHGPLYLRLDPGGFIKDMNEEGVEVFGSFPRKGAQGLSLESFMDPENRGKLAKLLRAADEQEYAVDVLPLRDGEGVAREMECHARSVRFRDEHFGIELFCRDVSRTVESLQQRQAEERLQGVLEMAGGIAHTMNQPLTVMNNLLHDVVSDLSEEQGELQDKLARILSQLDKLNEIAKKVRSVKQYKSVHYLLGEQIVDIDQLS